MQNDNEQQQAVIVLHGFENREISLIMRAVKGALAKRDIIFAKTTAHSLKMRVSELIEDVSEDHRYIKSNPPPTTAPAE